MGVFNNSLMFINNSTQMFCRTFTLNGKAGLAPINPIVFYVRFFHAFEIKLIGPELIH